MSICITGMHRSGTSMVTRLLNICGLYLGEENDLLEPDERNTRGYWENKHFMNLNDDVLYKLGGSWCFPPRVIEGWEKRSEFNTLRDRASVLINELSRQNFWGWKDPRNCLTNPFWSDLIPDLKLIVCVRNPIEAAHSLQRYQLSYDFGLHLWLYYYKNVISQAKQEKQIITHCDSYFLNPTIELKRILDFLEYPVSIEVINRACETIDRSSRHFWNKELLIDEEYVPAELINLYKDLLEIAGPVYQQILRESQKNILDVENSSIKKSKKIIYAKIGDNVIINFNCKFRDGTVNFTSINHSRFQFRLGDKQFPPFIEDALIGMREGEVKTIEVSKNNSFVMPYIIDGQDVSLDIQLIEIL
jgi:hypothetical protein